MELHPTAAQAGVRLICHDLVGSTNAEAMASARAGEIGPLWIVARRQSAGRGRRGNVWVSDEGNLYATLLLSDPARPARAPELSFVAGLAVFDAIVATAPMLAGRVAMKWPNDILVDGRKVAGILIEAEGDRFAIGVGINCTSHPEETTFPATSLAEACATSDAGKVFERLSAAMVARLHQWNRGAGFDAIRSDWLRQAIGIGNDIRVRLPDREVSGRFEGLDGDGRLLLRRADSVTEVITTGEVFGLNETFSNNGTSINGR